MISFAWAMTARDFVPKVLSMYRILGMGSLDRLRRANTRDFVRVAEVDCFRVDGLDSEEVLDFLVDVPRHDEDLPPRKGAHDHHLGAAPVGGGVEDDADAVPRLV